VTTVGPSRGRSSWPWLLVGLDIAVFLVASLLDPRADPVATLVFSGVIVSFGSVGAVLRIRVPRNPIGPMLLTVGTLPAVGAGLATYAALGAMETPVRPGSAISLSLANLLYVYPIAIALIGVPLAFPDGRLPSPRFRWIVWLTVVALAADTVSQLFRSGPIGDSGLANPLGVPALDPLLAAFGGAAAATSIIGFGGAAAAVLVRFRGPDPVVREQTKWLAAVAALAAGLFPAAFIVPIADLANALFALGLIAMIALPTAIGIAVLRYRLYEIDRIVSRTIGYGLVTGVLVIVFSSAVIAFEAVLAGVTETQGETLAVAASTLVAFALFQPLRQRIQRAVDRRFDRSRYDGERTSAAFSERLRAEVDLVTVTADLDTTVRAAMAPTAMGVWLRHPGAGRG
jgi:hypothetical protein